MRVQARVLWGGTAGGITGVHDWRFSETPGALLHTAWSWGLAGAIAIVVGTLVAADYRGVAARVPWVLGMSRLGFNRSVGARRRSFALLALWGVVMILLALR